MARILIPCPICRAAGDCPHREMIAARGRTLAQIRAAAQRASRPYSSQERRLHAAIIERHVAAYGWWCPGLPSLGHAAHPVKPGELDVDDILPVGKGGGRHDPANKRVLCRAVNRGRHA